MNLFDLVAVLSLNKKDYEKGLHDAEKDATSFGSKLKSGFGTVAKVGGAMFTATTGAVVAFGKSAVSAGQDFDKAMSQVAATMGKSVDDISNLRDFAQQMGATTSFSATEAAEALNYMALAGYDAETSMKMLPNVLNLAAAGDIDLAYASDMVTDAQTALGLSLEQTNVMVDQMAKTSSTTNTSVSQLGEAILTIGANAKNIKGGTAELTQVLGLLADNGIKGSEAGIHLRNIMLALTPKSKDAAEAMEELSFSAYDADGNLKSMDVIFGELAKSMDGMTNEERTNKLAAMFNKTDLAAVNALLDTNAERWDKVAEAIDDAEGSADLMAHTQLDNLAGDVTLFKSALEGLRIAVSDGVTPELRNFVKFGTDGLSKLTLALKDGGVAGAMDALGDIIADGLSMLMKKIPAILGAGSKLMSTILDTLFDTLPSVMEQVGQFIADNAGIFVDSFLKIVTKIVNSFSSIIRPIVKALPKIIKEIVKAISNNLPMIVQGIVELIVMLADELPNIIVAIVEVLPQLVTSIVNALIDNLPILIEGCITLVVELVKHLPEIIAGLLAAIPEILSSILSAFGPLGEMLGGLFSGFMGDIGGILGELPSTIGPILEEAYNVASGIFEWFGHLMDDPAGALKEAFDGVKSYAVKVFESLKTIVTGIFDLIDAKKAEAEAKERGEKIKQEIANIEQERGMKLVHEGNTSYWALDDKEKYLNYYGHDALGLVEKAEKTSKVDVSGTITHEGVNNEGELVASADYTMDNLASTLEKEARLGGY